MKKIILIQTVLLTFLISSNSPNQFFSEKETSKIEQTEELGKLITKAEIKERVYRFKELLGIDEKNWNKLIDQYYKEDKSWVKANTYLYKKQRTIKLERKDKIKLSEKNKIEFKEVKIPKWKLSMIEFKASSIDYSNVISAVQGLDMLLVNLGLLDTSGRYSRKDIKKIFDENLLVFTRVLKASKFCYGYVGETIYWSERKKKLEKAKNSINEGWNICKEQVEKNGVPEFMFRTMRVQSAKIKAIIKIRKAKGEI